MNLHRLTRRNIEKLQRVRAYPAFADNTPSEEAISITDHVLNDTSIEVYYVGEYEVKAGSYDNPIKNLIEHRNHAIQLMAHVDVPVYMANLHNIIDLENTPDDELSYKLLDGEIYSPELVDEVLALAAESEFNIEEWAKANQGKSLNDIHKSIVSKVREDRFKRREPKPIPVEVQANLRCINDLRRYMYENSARERVWTKAGTEAIPSEVLKMNVMDILRWLRVWKDQVWENKISRDDYGLKKCPECGMVDRRIDDHKCFVVKSRHVEYKGGIPLRKQTQVSTRGDKIITVTKRQTDLQQALTNYKKSRDNVAVGSEEDMADDIREQLILNNGRGRPQVQDVAMKREPSEMVLCKRVTPSEGDKAQFKVVNSNAALIRDKLMIQYYRRLFGGSN